LKLKENSVLEGSKTMLHEMMHMFGLDHCTFYLCVMNANVSPNDSNEDPIHLCPIDLQKLQHSIGFDIEQRYKELLSFYESQGWRKEIVWMQRRLLQLNKIIV